VTEATREDRQGSLDPSASNLISSVPKSKSERSPSPASPVGMSSDLTGGPGLQTGVSLHASPLAPGRRHLHFLHVNLVMRRAGQVFRTLQILPEVVTLGFISAPRRPSGIPDRSGARLPMDCTSLLGSIRDGVEVRSNGEFYYQWPGNQRRV
jgi:hypothetical protein